MKQSNKLKILFVTVLVLALIVSGTLIYLNLQNQNNIPTEKPKLKIASHTTMLGIVLEIGKEKGFYEQEGLDVEIKRVESSKESMAAMANGDIDIVTASIAAGTFSHLAKNPDLRIIADGARVVPTIVVRKDLVSRINDIEDLNGTIFVTPREGSASSYALSRILAAEDLALKDIDPKYLQEKESVAAFERKDVEAGILNEPFATSVVEKGIAAKFDFSKIEQIFPEGGQQHMLIITTTKISQNESTVKRFLSAYKKSAQYYLKALNGREPERSEVIRIASQIYGAEPEIIQKSRWPGISSDVKPDLIYLEQVQDFFLENKLIDQKVSLVEKTDQRFLS